MAQIAGYPIKLFELDGVPMWCFEDETNIVMFTVEEQNSDYWHLFILNSLVYE